MPENPYVTANQPAPPQQRGSPSAGGGKKNAPPPPDYLGFANDQAEQQHQLLNEQSLANRPNQQTPFASSQWTKNPDGTWSQSTGFSGPMGGASTALQQQLLQAMAGPLDFSGLPQVGSGEEARQQAIEASYSQATSRLDPRFSHARDSERTRLLNQGLSEGSEAYNKAMGELGMQENDAYNQAMYGAIGQGQQAGESLFRQGMDRRTQALAELLRQRGQPMAELQGMQGFLAQPGFQGAGQGQAPNLLGAAGMQDAAAYRNWQARQQAMADAYGAGMDLVGTAGSLAVLSDERAKQDILPLGREALPGVPLIAFRYRPELGLGSARYVGVSAQALQRALPGAVRARPDGLLEVHPAFSPIPLER